ncbi:hypothetical protein [Sphingomonas sp. HMP6]|uniref:hypothetical protein n=1 Tax=Sphingomonas sp. HMP6 TaxID=1517551 RepID=UPI001596F147|nr:hypothetical protein [Sphingomonas sp. HMP6]BCA59477.1 hypothetical protein HMP06_2246 [Sphingomonas sp. HMP6]
MTPDRALDRDTREDIEGLVHRGRITLPEVILADGTASPEQVAIVPPGVDLAKAFLPYRELPGPPGTGAGAAIVGTREPDIGPYLDGFGSKVLGDYRHRHITRPQSRGAILAWLYDITGIRYAPAAFWRIAGWEIGWAANWLDRMFTGGAVGELIVAERQAAAAVRAAWIAQRGGMTGSPLIDTGMLIAARAIIDMLAAFERVIEEALQDSTVRAKRREIDAARAAILQRLRSCITAIEDAATIRMLAYDRVKKIDRALDHARDLVESIGLFTAAGEQVGERVVRITQALPTTGRKPPPIATTFAASLNDLSARLETVIAAGFVSTTPTTWSFDTTGDLSRLHSADMQARVAALALVRTDLVYKLVVTRRLDRLFTALPWMAAPSGAFRLTYGGPLGAAADLFEVARYREIAIEQAHRAREPLSGARLDTTLGNAVYSTASKVLNALTSATRAGFWLAGSALSHHMVKAFLAQKPFDPAHPLPTLQAGRLDFAFERSMQDPATMATVTETERAKPIYASTDYHRDLPRYMGLTVADVLTVALDDVFPCDFRDRTFAKFTRLADQRRRDLNRAAPTFGTHKAAAATFGTDKAAAASRELLRSVLKSIDLPTDGISTDWRPSLIVTRSPVTVELRRFDDRNIGHNGDRLSQGRRLRDRASDLRALHNDPGKQLRDRVNRARTWKEGYSHDRPLAAILSGRHRLARLTPVAQTGISAIWFYPGIDTSIHNWIASGAPMWAPLAFSNVVHAGLIAREVQQVTAAMPLLLGMPIAPALRQRILVPLWTGLAGITEDHAHVR